MRKKLAVIGILACIGIGTVGTGVAHASSSSLVPSDKIKLTGTLVPGPAGGTFTFSTKTCNLTSDTETPIFPCQGSGKFTLAGTAGSGKTMVASADGSIQWKFSLTPVTATTYAMHGNGTEQDSSEGGIQPIPYSAVVTGSVTIVGTSMSMTAKVKEFSTQP